MKQEGIAMERNLIDLETYKRKDHFHYFKNLSYPSLGMTANMDITELVRDLREKKLSFYLPFVYKVVGAANSVPELRRSIIDGQIFEYEYCRASSVILKVDGPNKAGM